MKSLKAAIAEVYSEPCQTSKMECFNSFQVLNIFAKHSILDIWQGFEYTYIPAHIFPCSAQIRESTDQIKFGICIEQSETTEFKIVCLLKF